MSNHRRRVGILEQRTGAGRRFPYTVATFLEDDDNTAAICYPWRGRGVVEFPDLDAARAHIRGEGYGDDVLVWRVHRYLFDAL